tara:strand:+ start:1208 stop:1699 length:492 start_codon:yes stop_codon:yes gene_type:complete
MPVNKEEKPVEAPNHWQLFRDLMVFQFKLAMDGLRDIVLFPLSFVAALAGLVLSSDNPGKYFNRLLEFGRKSDVWINLFGAAEHYQQDPDQTSSDTYVKKLEEMLIAEYQRGGVVKNLKDGTDSVIDQIRKEAARQSRKAAKSASTSDPENQETDFTRKPDDP